MRIIRYLDGRQTRLAAVTDDERAYPLPHSDLISLIDEARAKGVSPVRIVESAITPQNELTAAWPSLQLLTPVDAPEVWAAGVTYQRSREARNYEATGGRMDAETFYDKVYDAVRPEIFLKSTAARTVGPNQDVTLRSDSVWQIPEPELGLVLAGDGTIVGYTAGNDMSCRDIEERTRYICRRQKYGGSPARSGPQSGSRIPWKTPTISESSVKFTAKASLWWKVRQAQVS